MAPCEQSEIDPRLRLLYRHITAPGSWLNITPSCTVRSPYIVFRDSRALQLRFLASSYQQLQPALQWQIVLSPVDAGATVDGDMQSLDCN